MIAEVRSSTDLAMTRATAGASVSGSPGAAIDFADALGQAIARATSTIHSAETASIKGIQGAESMSSVVESVMEAQRVLQTMVSIRDKAVGAWQEISRMTI